MNGKRIISALLALVLAAGLLAPAIAWDPDGERSEAPLGGESLPAPSDEAETPEADPSLPADAPAVTAEEPGEFTMTPANPYMGQNRPQNLLTTPLGDHAYEPAFGADEAPAAPDAPFVEGEVLYARKDTGARLFALDGATDDALAALGVAAPEEIFRFNDVSGHVDEAAGLLSMDADTVWYKADIAGDVEDTVAALLEVPGILYAEPNYIYEASSVGEPVALEPQSPTLLDTREGGTVALAPTAEELNANWLFTGAEHINTESGWAAAAAKTDGQAPGAGVVVAVIDTGVDYTHPDLAANMWINPNEIPDNGIDDDRNGYIDDVYGINATANPKTDRAVAGDPMDDQGHGTHVAGIIGMTAGNGGGVGVAYGAKVMAIKAGNSIGQFSTVHISRGLEYAIAMGADVINMSFGGGANSFLIDDILQQAFGSCVLVASAGNDGAPTSDAPETFADRKDFYPAAYPYVLGVMASDSKGKKASFSNWDYYPNSGVEYEIIAPGVEIYSTLPGGRHASWSGTSMAAPVVAAAAAVVRSCYPDKSTYSTRFIYGQLSSATMRTISYTDQDHVTHEYSAIDLNDSVTKLPKPNLKASQIFALDTKTLSPNSNDGDGIYDAGETIALGIQLKNKWGQTGPITITADANGENNVPSPWITFPTDEITIAPAGTYAETDNGFIWNDSLLTGVTNPILFRIDPNTPNDTVLSINLTFTTTNGLDEDDHATYTARDTFVFRVQRGMAIQGNLTEDMTLTADKYWIVQNGLFVNDGVTLTVEPGAQIQFWSADYETAYGSKSMAYIRSEGTLNMIGEPDNPIQLFPGAGFQAFAVQILGVSAGIETLRYCQITNPYLSSVDVCDHCYLRQLYERPTYRYLNSSSGTVMEANGVSIGGGITNSRLIDIRPWSGSAGSWQGNLYQNCTFEFRGNTKQLNSVFLQPPTGRDPLTNQFTSLNRIEYAPVSGLQTFTYGDHIYAITRIPGSVALDVLDPILTNLGGTFVCFSDQEEEYFVMLQLLDYMHTKLKGTYSSKEAIIGYTYDGSKFVWADNSNFSPRSRKIDGENININISTSVLKKEQMLLYIYYRGAMNATFSYGDSEPDAASLQILEFPNTVTEQDITDALKGIDPLPLYREWSPLSNCAILNPTLKTDTDFWNKVSAPNYLRDHVTPMVENYWGTENATLIDLMITDGNDYPGTFMDITKDPILTTESETLKDIYPFVTDIRFKWPASAGYSELNYFDGLSYPLTPGEEYTVQVTYNRDMDQTVLPSLTYGPDLPYTDFTVDVHWENARTLEGTIKVSPVATAGRMIFRVQGGQAANDSWLVPGTDYLRYGFNVAAATGAQAMVLQAEGQTDQVALTWFQDDYETLAGYNIYRSTYEDYGFQKINGALITGASYVDTAVQAGVTYYYYFKVVDTEGVELDTQSNIASGKPLDNVPPVLTHVAVTAAKLGSGVTLSATATDNISVESVTAYYRKAGASNYTALPMTLLNGKYTATIPASAVTADGVEYYIVAADGDRNYDWFAGPAQPQLIAVDNAPTISGAVLLDGTVTVYGANFSADMTVTLNSVACSKPVTQFTVTSDLRQFTFSADDLDLAIGLYDVVVTVGGRKAYRSGAFTVTDPDSLIQLGAGKTAPAGEPVRVPVYLSAAGDVTALHVEIAAPSGFSAVQAVSADGVSGSLDSRYSGGVLSVSMAGSGNIAPQASDDPIFYLQLTPSAVSERTQYPLTVQAASINGAPVSQRIGSKITVLPNTVLTATVRYFKGNKAVSGVEVSAEGISGISDESGVATLKGLSQGAIAVTARKDLDVPGEVTAYDASLALQHSVGKSLLTGNALLAADVNRDGKVDEIDVSLILQKSVGKLVGPYYGSYATWLIVESPKNVTIGAAQSSTTFTAILLGDVDGSWGTAS